MESIEVLLPYFKLNTWELIAILSLFLFFLIQLFFYLIHYRRLYKYIKTAGNTKTNYASEQPSVSVIIYSDNDANGLDVALQSVLDQDYPDFEVIVVNNTLTEESQELIYKYKEKYTNLYSTYIPENSKAISRKKLAITIAVKAAKNEILLFTEPNCRIESKLWIAQMVRNYTPGIELVLGYSRVVSKRFYLKYLAAYDNLFSAIQYLGKAVSGKPYKGLSRNLSYRKELFFTQKGFSKYLFLQAGDDDLFVHQSANATNTRVEVSLDCIPEYAVSRADWKRDKMRYALTTKYFGWKARALFRFEVLSRYLFYFLFLGIILLASLLYFKWPLAVIAGILFLIRFFVQKSVINKTAKSLNDRKYCFSLLYFDFMLPIINLYYKLYRKFDGKKDYTYVYAS